MFALPKTRHNPVQARISGHNRSRHGRWGRSGQSCHLFVMG